MSVKAVRLIEFLQNANAPSSANLPWVHTTRAALLFNILESKKLAATPCNVFTGEKLCYLFVGRPAYKFKTPEQASSWELPVVFVVRYKNPPPIKRVFPFDSGAFSKNLLPSYITIFNRDNYNFGPDVAQIGKLISVFFRDNERYWTRSPISDADFEQQYDLGARHQEVRALNRLFNEYSSQLFDDRSAAVEIQVNDDIELSPKDVLGVVVPSEYARDPEIMADLKSITQNVEQYDIVPLNAEYHFGQIYSSVKSIYKKFGILK